MEATSQEKIKRLKRYSTIDKEVQSLVDEIEVWRARAEKVTANLGGVGGNDGTNAKENAICKMADLQTDLCKKVVELLEERKVIIKMIRTVRDHDLQLLLKYRYVDCYTWERISVEMKYDVEGRNVHKLHGRAIEAIRQTGHSITHL